MTRKRYLKLMRMLSVRVRENAAENGLMTKKLKRDALVTNVDTYKAGFGWVCQSGKHKGERVTSYKQMWEILVEIFEPIYGEMPKR